MENLTFGNYPVRLRKVDTDIIINCKGINGLYSQVCVWKEKKNGNLFKYPYGVKTSEPCYIEDSIKPNHVNIACLDGSIDEVNAIIKQCEIILNT